jgi:hypothetical protein
MTTFDSAFWLFVRVERTVVGAGGSNVPLFYEYQEADDADSELLYTPCRKILNSSLLGRSGKLLPRLLIENPG